MNSKEELKKLFEKASQQAPLLDEAAVRSLLVSGGNARKSNFKKPFKIMSISIVVTAVTLGIFYFNTENKKEETVTENFIQKNEMPETKNEVFLKEKEEVLEEKTEIKSTNFFQNKTENTQNIFLIADENKTPNQNLITENIVSLQENSSFKINIENPDIPEGFEKNSFVVLDKSELEKLGIYMKDDIMMYEIKNTKNGDFKAYFEEEFYNYDVYNSLSSIISSKNPLLYFVTDEKGQNIQMINTDILDLNRAEVQKISKTLIPIWVQENNSTRAVIAWIENLPKTLEMLPKNYSEILEVDKFSFSHTLPKQEKEKTTKQESTDFEKKDLIVLDKTEMEKIGLFLKDNVIMFEKDQTKFGTLKLYVNLTSGEARSNNANLDLRLKDDDEQRNATPCLLTDKRGKLIQTFEKFLETYPKDLIEFSKELIPVYIQENEDMPEYIVWFENTSKIINLLPESYKANLENDRNYYSQKLPESENLKLKDPILFEKHDLIILDKNQLEKIGLFLKGNMLMFENKDTKFGHFKTFVNLIDGSSNAEYEGINLNLNSRNAIPCILTDKKGKLIQVIDMNYENNSYEEIIELSKELLPILIQENENSPEYIVWFENTSKTIKLFPEPYKTLLNIDKNYYANSLPKLKIANPQTILHDVTLTASFKLDKPLKEQIKDQNVFLDKTEMEKLGVFIKDGIVMYEMKNTRLNDVTVIMNPNENTQIGFSKRDKIPDPKNDNPLLLLITDFNGQIIREIHSDSNDYSSKYFEKIASKLIPIFIQENENAKVYILWFENNPRLISLLPETYQNNLKTNKDFYTKPLPKQLIPIYNPAGKSKKRKLIIADEQLVTVSDDVMKKLGFISQNPLHYYRKRLDSELQFGGGQNLIKIGIFKVNENKLSKLFPDYITPFDSVSPHYQYEITKIIKTGEKTGSSEYVDNNLLTDFEINKHKMIGIKVAESKDNYRVFWYKKTDLILETLSPEDRAKTEKYLEENKNKLADIEINTVKEDVIDFKKIADDEKIILSSKIKPVILEKEVLKKLGIEIENEAIVYKFTVDKDSSRNNIINRIYFDKDEVSANIENIIGPDYLKNINPTMVTDDLGIKPRFTMLYQNSDDSLLNAVSIPILVKSGAEYTTQDKLNRKHRPDVLFWFQPTELFLSVLDEKTANEIRSDLEALKCSRSKISFLNTNESACDDNKEISCKYFEACENSTQKAINKYLVYPNPTAGIFNVKLELKEQANIKVTFVTINGVEVKEEKLGLIPAGIQNRELTSIGMLPGMYLLRITSDKGDIIIERLIVTD